MEAKIYATFRILDLLLSIGIGVVFILKNKGSWRRRSEHPLHRGPRQWRFGLILLFFGLAGGYIFALAKALPGTPATVYLAGFLWVIFQGLWLDYKERKQRDALPPPVCPHCGGVLDREICH